MKKTATKAVTVFLTGANTWCAQYLSAKVSAAVAVATATVLTFLVPNVVKRDEREPVDDWGEGGQTDLNGALTLVVLVLLVLLLLKALGVLP